MKSRLKRVLVGALTLAVGVQALMLPVMSVRAEEQQANEEKEEETDEERAEREYREMKQAQYDQEPDSNGFNNWPEGPHTFARSAVLMDIDTGSVLYAKNATEKHYPASITKLLTTLVALENADLDDKVFFTEDSVSFLEWGDAHIGMQPGEEINLEDALYGVLLASANEVSYAVAESVGTNSLGGDYQTFIDRMNTRSQELGCVCSHWTNANGLHNDEHYTCAYDMALIGACVYQQEAFRNIEKDLQHTIGETNQVKETRTFQQNHKMVWPDNEDFYYPYATGGKTGFTDQSGTTLVTMAEKDGMRLVCVLLSDFGSSAYTATRDILEYGFNNFRHVEMDLSDERIEQVLKSAGAVTLPNDLSMDDLSCVISKTGNEKADGITEILQSRLATVTYRYENAMMGTATVLLTEEASGALPKEYYEEEVEAFEESGQDENHSGFDFEKIYHGGFKAMITDLFHFTIDQMAKIIPAPRYVLYIIFGVLVFVILLIIVLLLRLKFIRWNKRRKARKAWKKAQNQGNP